MRFCHFSPKELFDAHKYLGTIYLHLSALCLTRTGWHKRFILAKVETFVLICKIIATRLISNQPCVWKVEGKHKLSI